MGMKEVIEGTIVDTVNERLEKVKEEISKELDDIINKCDICSRTHPNVDVRDEYWERGNAVKAVKEIVTRKLDEAMTSAHPSGKASPEKGGVVQ